MELIVEVCVKNVYGNKLIYPANKAAEVFAELAGKKSLSHDDLRNIRALGFDVRPVLEEYVL